MYGRRPPIVIRNRKGYGTNGGLQKIGDPRLPLVKSQPR
jgi:hypothetical protein